MKNLSCTKRMLLIVLMGMLSQACSPGMASVIYGDNYDKTKDETAITMLPYGGVNIPGKWIKFKESQVSHQYFFLGPDSTTFAVALNRWDKYEFYNSQVTLENFVQKFYEWEADYFVKQTNGQVTMMKEDKVKNFIIWKLARPAVSEYFLFGLKGKVAYNLYLSSDHWDENKQIELLEKIYTQQ